MKTEFLLNLTIKSVDKILKTLSHKDYILILSSSENSNSLGFERIAVGTSDNKNIFRQAVQSKITLSKTLINYTRAFQTAFALLDQSVANRIKPPCAKPIVSFLLFSHEGQNKSTQVLQNISSIVESKSSSYQSRIFTFNMLSNIQNISILHDLACKYQGASFQINNFLTSQFLDDIYFHNTILANGRTTTKPIWTQPYVDAWGYGLMITVSMPVYKYHSKNMKTVFGVIAIDILAEKINSLNISLKQALDQISQNLQLPSCQSHIVSICELEALRKLHNNSCNLADCSLSITPQYCIPTTNQLFLPGKSTDQNICCQQLVNDPNTYVAIFCAVGGGIFIFLLIYCCYRRHEYRQNLNHVNTQTQQQPPNAKSDLNKFQERAIEPHQAKSIEEIKEFSKIMNNQHSSIHIDFSETSQQKNDKNEVHQPIPQNK